VSGALTALGDTLFPAGSLAAGIRQDFLPTAHFLIRLRVLHPFIAVSVGFYWLLFINLYNFKSSNSAAQSLKRLLTLLILIQLGAGLLNVILLAPDWMQLVHLFLADALWITMIFLTASTFEQRQDQVQASEKASSLNLEPRSVK
jgi:heme A synthase